MALKPSLRLALLMLLSHAIAATVAYATVMPQPAKLAIFILVLSSLFYYLVRDVLLLFPGSWREISLDRSGISVITRNGSALSGRISGKTAVFPYFVVLGVYPDGCRLPVFRTIFPDALGQDEFRALRVHLRFAQERP